MAWMTWRRVPEARANRNRLLKAKVIKAPKPGARRTTGEKRILAGPQGLQIPTPRFPSMRSQEPRFLPQATWRWLKVFGWATLLLTFYFTLENS